MGACELKRQARALEDADHGLPQQRHERKGMVRGTQYIDKDLLPLGKGNPFVGSRGTCARSFGTAATSNFCRTPIAA